MSHGTRSPWNSLRKLWNRRADRPRIVRRHLHIEPLESRDLLTVTLAPIAAQSLLAGAPLHLAISPVSDTVNPLTITVEVSNAALTGPGSPQLTAVIPQGNPSLSILVNSPANGINGQMTFQLFQDLAPETVDQIMALANSDFYNGLTFHRVMDGFMTQGGDPSGNGSGGPGFRFDDEFHSSLQFTSAGILAMANSGDDTNGSQFFITDAATRWLDFEHTIFGYLTKGDAVRQQISSVPVNDDDLPLSSVIMTDVSIFYDDQNGVLRLAAPAGTTGTADVTVTVTDSVTLESTTVTFQVTVGLDTTNNVPYLGPIAPIQTAANTPVTFTIPATDVEGDAMYFAGIVQPYDANLTLTVNSSTGVATLTPANGIAGVYSILVGVSTYPISSYDTQLVPVYITPAAPTSIQLTDASDTGLSNTDRLTNFNNSAGRPLSFLVQGLVTGAEVEVYADGVLIGQTVALGSSAVVVTNGLTTLADGARQITARQVLRNQDVEVGNLETTVTLESPLTAALTITVDATNPVITSTPGNSVRQGATYTYLVTTEETSGIAFLLAQSPTGMSIGATTGLITWTPTSGYGTTETIIVHAMDTAGNVALHQFDVLIQPPNNAPVLTPDSPSLGTTNENTATTVPLASLINGGAGTTTITDDDAGDTLGGIAVIGLTGNGTWAYSLDGTTYSPVGVVSSTSALLLPHDASLRYTPDSANAETPTITYRAWDATVGVAGQRADATTNGGITPFSAATDTASLTVTALNDAPVVTPGAPILAVVDGSAPVTISLTGTFLNNGAATTTIVDVDASAIVGGIALTGVTGNGVWEYSLDGTTFYAVGVVSPTSALLLASTASLRYTPAAGGASEAATISYRAWDATSGAEGDLVDTTLNGGETAFSTATDTASLVVNLAPALTAASPSLGTIDENSATTTAISSFINSGSGTTVITDANVNAQIGGIAIIGLTGNGTWAYSLDGTTFLPIGAVSPASALLLPHDAFLRYTADGSNSETATVVYRAWDATTGADGGRGNATSSGGAFAFSAAADTASLTVTAVNDAPTLTPAAPSMGTTDERTAKTVLLAGTFINNGTGTTIIADVDAAAVVGGIALTGLTGNGVWHYSLDGTTFVAVGAVAANSALLLPSTARLRYTPDGVNGETATIVYRAWDTTTGTAGTKVDASTNGGATAFSAASDTASLTVTASAPASISGFVYVDADDDGQRITPSGQPHAAIAGVTIELYVVTGSTTQFVASTQTAANGAYSFTDLVAGTYLIKQIQPSNFLDGKDTRGAVGGAARGTVGADQFQVQLSPGENGTNYNFGERGLQPTLISLRLLRASSSPAAMLTTGSTAPLSTYMTELAPLAAIAPADGEIASVTPTAAPAAEVVGRHVFFNNSTYDNFDPAPNSNDDNAIALDTTPLLPGQTTGETHTTTFEKGLNGIMVDIAALASASLTTDDFQFRVGSDSDPASWSSAPEPLSITVRPGAGINGADRVTIVWADYTGTPYGEPAGIAQQWLEVTVRATPNTGLSASDVFYFGHAGFDDELAALDLALLQGSDWLS